MILSCIAAVAETRVIGKDNKLPWNLSEDLKRFKKVTVGHSVIMGRKTFESIGRPLPDRTSIVITRNAEFAAVRIIVVNSFGDAIHRAQNLKQTAKGPFESFVIGGEAIFREALPFCRRLYLTRVHAKVHGNAFFPEIDIAEWQTLHEESHPADEKNDYPTTFTLYERTEPTPK